MFRKIMAGLIVLVWAALSARAAFPQSAQCAPYAELTAHLISKYDEQMVWHGDASPEAVVQLWSNAATQTWTVVAYRADGTGCFMASGTGFETFAPPPPERRAEP